MGQAIMWDDSLSVGVGEIDSDHRILVDQLGILESVMHDPETVGSVLNVLSEYTQYHFGREEELMRLAGWAGLEQHRRQHAAFVAKLKSLAVSGQETGRMGEDTMEFLKVWLTQHIMKTDKEIGLFISRSGVRSEPPSWPSDWSATRVVISDSQFNFRSILRSALGSIGITNVIDARNQAETMEIAETQPVDLFLVADTVGSKNQGHPIVSGIRRLGDGKARNAKSGIFIMPTGAVTRNYLKEAIGAGCHDVLMKPLSINSLRSKLQRHSANPLPMRIVDGRIVVDHVRKV